jgi:6-phosphofructokinase 1
LIGQSGGPTSVINASLAGLVDGLKQFDKIDKILGMRFGIEGFMQENIVDLSAQPQEIIAGLKTTPSSALGSCRHKLQQTDLPVVLELLKKYNIRYIFLIGGNDTMDTIHRIEDYAKANAYDMIGIGVPKTVDNDLFGTDHTPGFASAAKYMALSVQQAGILGRDMQKVDQFSVFQTIGRDAGWLGAATAITKNNPEDPPHLIYMPERPFTRDTFLADVKKCYDNFGFVSVVCGEGITYADGSPVSASETKDKFSNVEFGAMGGSSVAVNLHKMISDEFGFRGEFQITESLPMCAADRAVQLDIDEAYQCGLSAIELAKTEKTGLMITIERTSNAPYASTNGTIPLSDVAIKAKPMPQEYINHEGNFITDAFLDYVRPLIGTMPDYVKLSDIKYNK